MKRSILAAAMLASIAFAGAASAAEDTPTYNYVDAGYVKIDDLSDGWGLRGGLKFGDTNFYGNASYSRQEIKDWDVNYNLTNVNVGYAHPLATATHLNAEVGYQYLSADGNSADGYRAGVGVRHAFNDTFEGLVRANHYFAGDTESDTTGTVGAALNFSPSFGAVAEVEFGNGGQTYMVGARYRF